MSLSAKHKQLLDEYYAEVAPRNQEEHCLKWVREMHKDLQLDHPAPAEQEQCFQLHAQEVAQPFSFALVGFTRLARCLGWVLFLIFLFAIVMASASPFLMIVFIIAFIFQIACWAKRAEKTSFRQEVQDLNAHLLDMFGVKADKEVFSHRCKPAPSNLAQQVFPWYEGAKQLHDHMKMFPENTPLFVELAKLYQAHKQNIGYTQKHQDLVHALLQELYAVIEENQRKAQEQAQYREEVKHRLHVVADLYKQTEAQLEQHPSLVWIKNDDYTQLLDKIAQLNEDSSLEEAEEVMDKLNALLKTMQDYLYNQLNLMR